MCHPSIFSSIVLSIHSSIYIYIPSSYTFIVLFVNKYNHPPMYPSTHSSIINSSIPPSIFIIYSFNTSIYRHIHLIQPSIYSHIYHLHLTLSSFILSSSSSYIYICIFSSIFLSFFVFIFYYSSSITHLLLLIFYYTSSTIHLLLLIFYYPFNYPFNYITYIGNYKLTDQIFQKGIRRLAEPKELLSMRFYTVYTLLM